MQDDVTDGVQALIDQGIADPKRVCIVGWSYGGYAALAGATFTPELYACAASIGGVSDLPEMVGLRLQECAAVNRTPFAYWREHIGTATDPQVIAKSPARFASAVRAPILLIHGIDDYASCPSASRSAWRARSRPRASPTSSYDCPAKTTG